MPIKHREDIELTDFWLASRFKAYLLADQGAIVGELNGQRMQSWKLDPKTRIWEPGIMELDLKSAILLPRSIFKRYCRGIANESGATEPQVIDALKRLSLLRFDLEKRFTVKFGGLTCIKLEARRLTGRGTIRKRPEGTLEETLEAAKRVAMSDCVNLSIELGGVDCSDKLPAFEVLNGCGVILNGIKKRDADTARIRAGIKREIRKNGKIKKTQG